MKNFKNNNLGQGEIKTDDIPPNIKNLSKEDYNYALKRLGIDYLQPLVFLYKENDDRSLWNKPFKEPKNPNDLESWIIRTILRERSR